MGQNTSRQEEELSGYRVLGVQPNSPASGVGFVPFFDFIVSANGVPLNKMDGTFMGMIKMSEDRPLPISIYNWKNNSLREVQIIPRKNWGGQGMLGVTIRFDTYFQADRKLVRVIEVVPHSPAHKAGLQPLKDYLLGTAERAFTDSEMLFSTLKNSLDQPVDLFVYNTDTDTVRIVVVLPTLSWGGEGIFGANIAHGYLHQLPAQCRNTMGKSLEGIDQTLVTTSLSHEDSKLLQVSNFEQQTTTTNNLPMDHNSHNDDNIVSSEQSMLNTPVISFAKELEHILKEENTSKITNEVTSNNEDQSFQLQKNDLRDQIFEDNTKHMITNNTHQTKSNKSLHKKHSEEIIKNLTPSISAVIVDVDLDGN